MEGLIEIVKFRIDFHQTYQYILSDKFKLYFEILKPNISMISDKINDMIKGLVSY